jgi:outer membrane lipoprotein carrier protein
MNMKKIVGVVALSCLGFINTTFAQNDPKAKTILESASNKINSLSSVKANFTLSLLGANGKVKEKKSGTFLMKGNKYRINISGQEIICDGKTIWTYVKETNEVQISDFNPNDQSISPSKLFTNFYDKEYNYKYSGQKTISGKTCDVINMSPSDKSKNIRNVELHIDKTNTLTGGLITEKNGNQFIYSISGFTSNVTVADNTFTFDSKKYPGVEVVDLR